MAIVARSGLHTATTCAELSQTPWFGSQHQVSTFQLAAFAASGKLHGGGFVLAKVMSRKLSQAKGAKAFRRHGSQTGT